MEKKENHYGVVYAAINKVNGKAYVGKSKNFNKRKKDHLKLAAKGDNDLPKFYKALRKYGQDNFKWKVLQKSYSDRALDRAEDLWIIKYDSIKNGYNCGGGGKGFIMTPEAPGWDKWRKGISRKNKGRKPSEETLKKLRIATTGKNNGMYGRKHTNETRLKQSKIAKERYKKEPWRLKEIAKTWKGKERPPFSKETKRKMSIAAKKVRKKLSKRRLNLWNKRISETRTKKGIGRGKNNPNYKHGRRVGESARLRKAKFNKKSR